MGMFCPDCGSPLFEVKDAVAAWCWCPKCQTSDGLAKMWRKEELLRTGGKRSEKTCWA